MSSRFTEILEQIPLMRCVAMSLALDRDVADELVENALLEVKEGGGKLNGGTNVRIELFYSLYNHTRERVAERDFEGIRTYSPNADRTEYFGQEPISAAINAMDFERRSMLIFRSLGDFSYDELAQISGLSKRDVSMRISQAREELHKRLSKANDIEKNEFEPKESQPGRLKLFPGR